VKPKIAAAGALVVLAWGLLAAACGTTDHEAHARSLYNAYRTAEDSRTDAEEELRLAFRDIANAAQAQDRDAVVEAAQRGQDAVDQIDDLLTAELEAAQRLEEIDSVSAHAKQLSDGLRLSRSSLALVGDELAIALDDPFLETRKNEIDDLAKESADLADKGERAIRLADHALALALGLEPRLDQMFTTTSG
jgi:3-methyladenine DNA glycosylase AlkD